MSRSLSRPRLTVNAPRFMVEGSSRLYYDSKCKMFKNGGEHPVRRAVLSNGHWMLWSEPPTRTHSLFHHPNVLAPILLAALRKATDAAFTKAGRATVKHSWIYDGYLDRLDMVGGVPDMATVIPPSGNYVLLEQAVGEMHGSVRPERVRLSLDKNEKGTLAWDRDTGKLTKVGEPNAHMPTEGVSIDLLYWLALEKIGMRLAVMEGSTRGEYKPVMIVRPAGMVMVVRPAKARVEQSMAAVGVVMPVMPLRN